MKMKVELKINMITLMEEKVTLANQIEIARLKESLRIKDELNLNNQGLRDKNMALMDKI